MTTIKKIDYNKLSSKQKELIKKHTGQNIRKVIFESIKNYNFKSQLDIAEILFKEYSNTKDRTLQINIMNRILTLWFEFCDQLYLIFILAKTNDWNGYIIADNLKVKEFFQHCIGGLPDKEICKVYGFDEKFIRFQTKEVLETIKKAFRSVGNMYDEKTAILEGINSIKHGYKVIYKSPSSEKLFMFDGADYLVPAKILEVDNYPKNKQTITKKGIYIGLFAKDKIEERDGLEKIIRNMHKYSELIKEIATFQLRKIDDCFFYLSKGLGLVKIPRNDNCPCKQKNPLTQKYYKYKNCHGKK